VESRPTSGTTRAIAELTALSGRPAAQPGPATEPVPASQIGVFRPQESAPRTGPRPDGGDSDGVSWPETTRLRDWLSGRLAGVLTNRRILIVDDDIRNVFALTHVLGRVGISVKYAENGREGLEVLDRTPDVSLVLMDIMMPEMDGYEMIAAIRRTPRFADLPIIALTAKAMPGDREKAIESGANEYVPKPVDVDRLLSVICRLFDPHCTLPEPRPDPCDGARSTDHDDTPRNTGDDDGATGRPS
jgi:CheY-like chemotaxis protein